MTGFDADLIAARNAMLARELPDMQQANDFNDNIGAKSMTQQLAIVDLDDIKSLRAEVRALHAAIKGATITPRPDWYSIPDAARELGVTVDTMRRKINAGKYQATGTGKSRRVRLYP